MQFGVSFWGVPQTHDYQVTSGEQGVTEKKIINGINSSGYLVFATITINNASSHFLYLISTTSSDPSNSSKRPIHH